MTHTYERSSAKSVLRKPFLIHMLSLMRYYEKWNRFFYAVRRNRGAIKASVFAVFDLAALNLSFLAAYYLRNLLQPLFVNSLYPVGWYGPFIIFYNLVFFIALVAGGLYRVRRETPFSEEFMRVVRAVFLGLVVLLAATYISRVRIYSRAVVLGQAGIAVFAVALFRRVIREIHRELVKARFDLKRVIIVGSEAEAIELAERLAGAPELGIDVVGHAGEGAGALGTPEELPDLLERFKIQEVLICPSRQNDTALLPFLAHSRRRVIQIRMISPLARFLGQGVRVEELAGLAVFSLERRILFRFERGIKRLSDCAAGAIALPFVECAFLAYRLYASMKGTVAFFDDERRGRRGRSIAWPRALRASGREAGDFVKPALCLALIGGKLSLVGPPSLYEGQEDEFEGALARVRPGITGRWRLSRRGSRREALEEEALGLESWSLERDIMTFMESIGMLASGTYPRWFFSKGDAA
jgi:lipopolysaccharide/colanic/teichoic acid biosynthesis glycosyltransferase